MNGHSAAAVTKLALLIDGDNISASYLPLIIYEAEKYGVTAVRRVYGQFKSGRMKSWLKHIDEFDLTAVDVSPLTRGKNATDMKLVIEAMDMLHGRQLDGLCIASSDGDFAPLVTRLRANALAVYGFGAKKAPAAYKELFDRFFECDTLLTTEKKAPASKPSPSQKPPEAAPAKAAPKPAPARKPARGKRNTSAIPPSLSEKILEVIERAASADGRSHVRAIGNAITRAIPGFRAKDYGHGSTAALIRALPGVEVTRQGTDTYVRRKNRS
jgi:hypothetical protein